MTIRNIQGTLAATNVVAVTKTAIKIDKTVRAHGLSAVMKPSPAWNHGIIVTSYSPEETLTDTEFTSRLREFVTAEDIDELGLEGTLTVKFDNKKNDVKVIVEAGNITYKEVKPNHYSDSLRHSILYFK